jgi:hypothetical protein
MTPARSQTDRARAYLAKLPPAVAGQSGHAATFAAACRLVEFGLSYESAWALLLQWNGTHCQPPWCERDLRHKLTDAFRRASPKADFTEHGARNGERGNAAPFRPPLALLSRPQPCRRPQLPPMTPGTERELAMLAELRRVSVRFGRFRGLAAWFVTDGSGRTAQARRMDGKPWAEGVKAWTLPGSQAAWPVGIGEAEGVPVLALCEGGPDLLAAHGFLVAEGRAEDCAAVAMLGASCALHANALPRFAGKRIRIFGHADAAGLSAVERWAAQLADVGADVDAFNFAGLRTADGAGAKDLNDLARVHPDDFDQHPCLRTILP